MQRKQNKPEKDIVRHILGWYKKNVRDLPWRKTRNPYRILVSEIMLQQTQVDRVIPKYKAFLKTFPSIKQLAEASTADVIKAWKGLGYNRRALFLQRAAQAIRKTHGGRFPKDLDTLKSLPGVGDYTARAILSFAYEEPVPMMDTNHRRFYQRIFFGHKKINDRTLLKKAEAILPKRRAYDWNQALMDFGSLALCSDRNSVCSFEPIRKRCKACNSGKHSNIQTSKHKNSKTVKQEKERKCVPFRETDRYYRGRIIDRLREKDRLLLSTLRSTFNDISDERFQKIINQLGKDGLIKREKHAILFP